MISILSQPQIRYFVVDDRTYAAELPHVRMDRRPRIEEFLQEHFLPPVIREVRGNPLESVEATAFLVYKKK